MSSRWHCFSSPGELDAALADHLAASLRGDLDKRGLASLALSGGNTPRGMFRQLGQRALDWQRVHLTLVDERWVETDHPDSNEGQLREHLYRGPVSQARFAGLKTAHARATEGESEAGARISALPRPFTAVVLGMGSDGHTASWFPRAANLDRLLDLREGGLVAATEPVSANHSRMTLTLAAVLASGEIIIHITGEDKKVVLQSAVERGYPIAAVLQQTRTPVSIWWAPND